MKKEVRKRRRNRRIIFLCIWTLFLFLMLSTSTYAWFTVNRVVSIDSLDIKVNVKGGMEVSTDGENWKTSLTSDDIINAHANYPSSINQLPAYLEPVSSGGLTENHLLKMYYGVAQTINGNNYYSINSIREIETESNGLNSGKYIAFDLFLKLENESGLYLSNTSGAVIPEGVNDVGIQNALRVAFLYQGFTDLVSNKGVSQNLLNAEDKDVYIWQPNYDIHTPSGVSHALNIYNITTSETGGALIPYDGIINEFSYQNNISVNRATSLNYPLLFKTVDTKMTTTKDFPKSVQFFDKVSRGIHKLRIYIWVEGQDVDCEDHASSGNILFNISLSTLSE